MRNNRPRFGLAAIGAVCAWTVAVSPGAASDVSERRLALPAISNSAGAADKRASDDAILSQPVDPWSPREAEAAAFASALTVRARAIFADPGLDAEARRRAFRTLVADVFDVDALAMALLGGNRSRFTERQMKSYEGIVPDYLVKLYASRIYSVCSTNPAIVSVEEQPGGVLVRTAYGTDPGVAPTIVDWLLSARADGSWRVLDMAVGGVSLAQAKMEEFDAVLSMSGPDVFLELLHVQAGQGLPSPLSTPVAPEPQPRGF